MNKLLQQFNKPDTYLVISDYPEVNKKGQKNYGIAWYTKELLEPIAKKYGTRFVVLAENAHNNKPQLFQNDKILLLRVFDQRHPSLFPRIINWLQEFNKIKNIHVHSEFAANGGVKNMLLILPFLFLIKLNRKHITYFSHNVVTDLNAIAPHLDLEKNSLKLSVFSKGLSLYYRLLGLIVDRFVVMDTLIQQRLAQFVPENKIVTNPFWVRSVNPALKPFQAKRKLKIAKDEFTLLYFGFVTYYKGADWIIKTVKELKRKKKFKKLKLIIAGGEAYSLKDKMYYRRYYARILKEVHKNTSIQVTGFVSENDIDTYFQAADLVVFPYRGVIGASASMLHAISYKKPFIASEAMQDLYVNPQTAKAFDKAKVKYASVLFKHTEYSFEKILTHYMQPKYLKRLQHLSEELYKARERNKLITSCYNELYKGSVEKKSYGNFITIPVAKIIASRF